MDEVPSNQDNPGLRPFPGGITGAMFAEQWDHPAGSFARRPGSSEIGFYDMAMVGSNRHGASLLDDHSLASAFDNMSLSFTDRATADGNLRNGSPPLHPAFAQDDLMPSFPMINNPELMKAMFGGQNPPVNTGMHSPGNAYVNRINLPPPFPFEQQLVIDRWPQEYAPHQQMETKFRGQDIDAEKHFLMQSQHPYLYQQLPHVSDVQWINDNQYGFLNSSTKSAASPHPGHGNPDIYSNGALFPNESSRLSSTRVSNLFRHSYKGLSWNKLKSSPEKILMKYEGVNSIRNIKPGFALDDYAETNKKIDYYGHGHHLNVQNDSLYFDLQSSQCSSFLGSELAMKSAQLNINSVDEVVRELHLWAKDQNGCHFLQRIFIEGSEDDAQKVFDGVIEHIDELMVDPFGNYLVQKIFEQCNDDQRMHILYEMTKTPGQLSKVACNMHGTRVVQKVIETISVSDEVSMVVSALSPNAITLMMDVNGSHVVHRCLQKAAPEYKAFVLNTTAQYCIELAKDQQGCCIIQKCIMHGKEEQKDRLLHSITSRALDLAEHQYGNYVIQYIFELKITWATTEILDRLEGHYGYLSMQKCSSNVVEKCLRKTQGAQRAKIINELISDPKLFYILVDQYGNYVMQTAFRECEDATVEAAMVKAIKPHVPALRNNMFGKRVLSKTCLKNRKL
ncbi:hypothetical protein U9M48_036557 [Paspalum notatum var. saurae]|uniref:PUM-HD domain-containing protein n=1 Tax=Paspalum notatum var. saurae TaxID=547442 RepID=A0AAQ3UEB3_PASNO